MRDRITCDQCEENITFWANIYKTTYQVTAKSTLSSSQHYDFCSVKCMRAYFRLLEVREG